VRNCLRAISPTARRIREIDAKLARREEFLDNEDHLEVSEKSTDLNPIWVTIDSNLNQAKASVASLKASHESLAQEVAATKQQLTEMVNNAVVLERLERTVQSAKDAYLSYGRKSEEARAAEALNRSRILM